MSKIKKLIALTLALAMVLSVSAFAGYTADTYADAAKITEDCESAVELMYALDIMTGNEKGEFMPEKAVTRAEMAKIIYVILNYGKDDGAASYLGSKFFTDVQPGNWAEGYINYCAATKLIAGRGDGKFDPTAPVTTAEAAKMMLTAIGYNAEARGYVGDKWSDNTLSDAATIGLLAGYKANVLEAAPRQWIAVMLENLLEAYTYTNMAPAFSGLLTSGYDMGITTMGEKYYGVKSFSAVAVATEDAYIDQNVICEDEDCEHEDEECYSDVAADGVLFANGKEVAGTGLKVADLGQKYKVIYDASDADNLVAYSVRSLGATDEARIYEAEYDIKHATDKNQPNNKYVFTFGDVTGTLAGGDVKYLTSEGTTGTLDAVELRALIDAAYKSANDIKAIDSENNGTIDYLYITEYVYGYVTEVATSEKYGKYINVAALSTEEDDAELWSFNDGENLYLKDCVITSDDIEEEVIVKASWSLDSGKIVIEVLPQVKGAEYEEFDDEDMIFVLGDKEYFVAETEADYDYEDEILEVLEDEDNLGEKYNVVYDGDLIVYIWQDDDRYDNMDAVNEQLVLLVDANDEYSNNTIREKEAIEYMTIDGKTHIAVYDVDTDSETAVDFDTLMGIVADESEADRLYKIKNGTKGRVYLEELDAEDINAQLKVKKSVLNGYEEGDAYTVDATGSAVKVEIGEETYKVDADNKYFVGGYSKGELTFKVMTLDELKHCIDEDAYAQILTYTNDKGTRTTVVGGYLFLELTSDTATDYLYIEKIGRITGDGRKCDVVFSDGTEKSIVIENDEGLVEDVLYTYVYNFMDDDYTVTIVELGEQNDEIADLLDNELFVNDGSATTSAGTLKKETIAIVTIKVDRDRDIADNDAPEFKLEVKGIKFVDLADLKLAMIENNVDSKTYTQYTDYVLAAEDLFYVADFQIMDTAQEITDELPELLAEIFESILAGEETIVIAE